MAQYFDHGKFITPNAAHVFEPISQAVFDLYPENWVLLSLLPGGIQSMPPMINAAPGCCGGPSYKHAEQQDLPNETTLDGAITDVATTIDLVDAKAKSGDQIEVQGEIILLGTAATTVQFTGCTRSVGTVAAAAHADGATVKILKKANLQGAALSSDIVRLQPDIVTNWTQIFNEAVGISGTAAATTILGANPDQLAVDKMRIGTDLMTALQTNLIWSVGQAPTSSAAGRPDGVYERLIGVNSYNLSSGDITPTTIEPAVSLTDKYHGSMQVALVLFVSPFQKNKMDNTTAWAKVQLTPGEQQVWGTSVSMFLVGGRKVAVLKDHDLAGRGLAVMVSPSALGVGPLAPVRQFTYMEAGQTIDGQLGAVVGEYGQAIIGTKTHAIFIGVNDS